MKVLLGYLIISFFGGMLLWRQKPAWRKSILIVLSLFICFAYYFLNQI